PPRGGHPARLHRRARGGGRDPPGRPLPSAGAHRRSRRTDPLPARRYVKPVGGRASRVRPSADYPLKLIFLWLPSQRGFLAEAPQRQRYAASPFTGTGLPCGSNTSMPSPLTMRGPSGSGLTTTAIDGSFFWLGWPG